MMPSTTATPVTSQSCIWTGSMALGRWRRGRTGRGPGSNGRASAATRGAGALFSSRAATSGVAWPNGKLHWEQEALPAGFSAPQPGQVIVSDMVPRVVGPRSCGPPREYKQPGPDPHAGPAPAVPMRAPEPRNRGAVPPSLALDARAGERWLSVDRLE